jgi:prepilin peptidase CpaA
LGGWTELRGGLFGMMFAGGIFFLLFLLGGMGGGDVKLMAAVGAWVGAAQVGVLLIMSALAGGLLATGYVLVHKRMFESLRNMVELLRHHLTDGLKPHPTLNVQQGHIALPYGLAIAIVLFMRW